VPSAQEYFYLAPEMLLATAGLILLLFGSVGRGLGNREAAGVSLFGLALTGGLLGWLHHSVPGRLFILQGSFVIDGFSFFWKALILVATALTVLLSVRFLEEGGYRAAEYYALILLASSGMMFMASGYTLLTIWISLETMALASYILAGYFKHHIRSNEAALKYFILGALSSGIMLYGISLLYGAAGTVQLDLLAQKLGDAMAAGNMLVPLGWILLACGLFFKVSAVPFHVWTPDVYTGAPTPVTAYLAVASKGASFAILLRIFYEGFGTSFKLEWQWIVAVVAAATMIWGNLAALTQENVKSMLAYTFITMGAFATVILLERKEYAGETCADYAGLAQRSKFLAAMMLVFLLALTGIPPTGGFFGKVYLFAAAVQAGWTWVAVIGVLTSAISLYYYFRIVVYMYLRDSTQSTPVPLRAPALVGVIGFCAIATLVLGLYPEPFIQLAKASLLPAPDGQSISVTPQ